MAAEPEPQADGDLSASAKALITKGETFLSDNRDASGCPLWGAASDAAGGAATVWRGERCVHYLGEDGKGRTMPFKAEGVVEGVSPETVLAHNLRLETKWNDKKRKPVVRLVEKVNPCTAVWYEQRAMPWPIWNRESCYMETWEKREDGSILVVRESIAHPGAAFDDTQMVALREFAAQLLTPDGNGNTKYVLSTEFNVGGMIPGGLIDKQLQGMAQIAQQLTGKFKEDPALAEAMKTEGAAMMAAAGSS
jgi:hypothetical protein